MNRTIGWVLGVVFLTALTGCETVKGVGRDITGASGAVQEQFSGNKNK